jgi:energy-coupling factor transport system permease protein
VSLVPVYRDRPSPLHSARPGAAAGFCAALALTGILYEHPIVLLAALAATLAAGAAAGVGDQTLRALWLSLPLALLVTVINPLVYAEGDTLLVRGGVVLGRRVDVTLEAVAAGGLAGLRVMVIVVAFGLLSAAVDPDGLLRLFRRVSYRSALTAALAVRLIPVLARDAARMGDASRCRPVTPGRLAAARAALSGALDRAVDVAAALEVRGYASARRPARDPRRWSRHDLRVGASAVLIGAAALAGFAAGAGPIEEYPRFELPLGALELGIACALLLASALPFAGRGARLGVAHG